MANQTNSSRTEVLEGSPSNEEVEDLACKDFFEFEDLGLALFLKQFEDKTLDPNF